MRRALVGLARPRPDPLKVDRGLAVLLTVGLELEIWLGSTASDERLPTALLGAVVTGAVAVRRRYPARSASGPA